MTANNRKIIRYIISCLAIFPLAFMQVVFPIYAIFGSIIWIPLIIWDWTKTERWDFTIYKTVFIPTVAMLEMLDMKAPRWMDPFA